MAQASTGTALTTISSTQDNRPRLGEPSPGRLLNRTTNRENTMKKITVPLDIQTAQVIFVSHSGGKDSQAMLALLIRLGFKGRIVLVHSDLGEMEWEPMHHWIEKNSFGLPVHVVRSEMTFFDMVRKYKRIPSGNNQFCTDFLKIVPIEAFIHDYMTKHGLKTAVNATGMRAEESKRRAEKEPFQLSEMTRKRKFPDHMIFDWLPLFDYSTAEVLEEIKEAGQVPHHVYSLGFSRLSCVFCVNGRIGEHQQAAILRPELALKMAKLEREVGKTIRTKQINKVKHPKFLDEYINIADGYCG